MSALAPILNFVEVVVDGLYAAGVVTVNLQAGEGASLPQPSSDGEFWLVWWNVSDYPNPADDPKVEIVRVTARSTDQLTIVRGEDGTADTTKNTSGKTYHMRLAPTKALFDQIKRRVLGLDETASVTISSGAITKDAPILIVAGEGATTDDLTDINAPSGWTLENGEMVLIRPSVSTYDITLKSTGNLTIQSEDLILRNNNDYAIFAYFGSAWRLIAWKPYFSMWSPFSGDSTGEMYTEREVIITPSTVAPSTLSGHNFAVQSDAETPMAVNRETDDGALVTWYQDASNVGSITVSGTTVSYDPFMASHFAQLKQQVAIPEGAVIVALSEMIEGAIEYYEEKIEKSVIDPGTNKRKAIIQTVRHYPEDDSFSPNPSWLRVRKKTTDILSYRQFPYVDGTTIENDPKAYGVYYFDKKTKPIKSPYGRNDINGHLIASIGLFKIRVTDTGGNISAGDYLSSSSLLWEAQKQADDVLHNYTIAKALTDVDFSTVAVDPVLGHKWVLIPCTLHCG
jgi:hypothetical protein